MRNYYLQIQQYLEKLVHGVVILDKKGINKNGDTLSITELIVLKALGDQEEKKMFEILEEMRIDRNSLGSIVNKLQAQKYILKKKSDSDKRVQVLQLTDKGKATFDQIVLQEKELLSNLLNDFTFNEEKAVLKFLVKLNMLKKYNI